MSGDVHPSGGNLGGEGDVGGNSDSISTAQGDSNSDEEWADAQEYESDGKGLETRPVQGALHSALRTDDEGTTVPKENPGQDRGFDSDSGEFYDCSREFVRLEPSDVQYMDSQQNPGYGFLLVRVKKGQQDLYIMHVQVPLLCTTQTIDWIGIADHEVNYNHIRCLQLSSESKISDIVEQLEETGLVKCLVLISHKSYHLDQSSFFHHRCNFPILVAKFNGGAMLLELLKQFGRKVDAKVELFFAEKRDLRQITESKEEKSGFFPSLIKGVTKFFTSKQEHHYKVATLLFPQEGPKIASEDAELFQKVMKEFGYYEKEGSKEKPDPLLLIADRCHETIQQDLPFYIALMFRVCVIHKQHYTTTTRHHFEQKCILAIEKLPHLSVAASLLEFLSRDDFNISLDLTQTGHSVFSILKDSMEAYMTDRINFEPRSTYRTMLWITLYVRFCVCMPFWKADTEIWHYNFMKDADKYELHPLNIEGLKKAVELIQYMKLPSECTFNTKMAWVFILQAGYCQFPKYIKLVQACEMAFDSPEDLKDMIFLQRDQHTEFKLQHPKDAMKAIETAQKRTLLGGVVKEGLQFLKTLLDVVTTKKWKREQFDEEVRQWLLLLLDFVLSNTRPLPVLKTLIFSEDMISDRYQAFIIKKITENTTTRDLVKLQDVRTFSELCLPTVQHWPVEFLDDYVTGLCKAIPAYRYISLVECKTFLGKMTERFQHASQQKGICTLLLTIAKHYRGRNVADQFIPGLLQLDIPRLLCASGEKYSSEDQQTVEGFKHGLHVFICENFRDDSFLYFTSRMMNHITENATDCFQEAVLAVVLKAIPLDSKLLQDPPNGYVKQLLSSVVHVLESDMTWVQKKLSIRHNFCLYILNMYCVNIRPLSYLPLNWVEDCKTILQLVTSPFVKYFKLQQSVNCGDIPEEVSSKPSVQQYFEWVQKHYQLLQEWKEKLQYEDANYDNIYWYTNNYQRIVTLAHAISATHLLVTKEQLAGVEQRIKQTFWQLNSMLIRCIPTKQGTQWCSLVTLFEYHGVEIPKGLQLTLHSKIAFPDEEDKYATIDLLDHTPFPDKSSVSLQLRMSKKLKLAEQDQLIKELGDFLKPITNSGFTLLVYFKLRPSKLFNIHLRHALESKLMSASERAVTTPLLLNEALQKAQSVLIGLLNGTATYHEMTADGSLLSDVEKLDVEEEFKKLIECPNFSTYKNVDERIIKIKNLLKLIQSKNYIKRIESVCQQYQLKNCLQDPQLKELVQMADVLSDQTERSELTPVNAQPRWEKVCSTLCLIDGSMKCLELFSKVEANTDFYNFLKEKQFTGSDGETRFYQQLGLITAQLQHEEYSETVLNHLYAAFKFIAPFMDPSQDFHCFMTTIAALEVPSGVLQLETVKSNMHIIRYWFSRAEDTLENVSNELKCILTTGFYQISSLSVSGRSVLKLVLEYEPSSSLLPERRACLFSRQTSTSSQQSLHFADDYGTAEQPPTEIHIKLTTDQINDLVHKLGFLDSKGDEEANVHNFQHLNEIAYRLLELISKLKELGHPSYSDANYTFVLRCSDQPSHADEEVLRTEKLLTEWIHEVDRLHHDYKWLLFFNIPKLMNVHSLLKNPDPCATKIFHEVSFLFKKDADTRERVKKFIGCITADEGSKSVCSPSSPMDEVSSFLHKLFSEEELSQSLLPKRCTTSHMPNVLHSCPGCSQSLLIELIIRIYNGPPEAFEIFHCSSTTTEQDLRLFVKRMVKHARHYLFLEVSKLPYQLQEILLQLYLGFIHELGNTEQTRVDFIETAPSILHEVPWLKLIEYKGSNQPAQAQEICREIQLKLSKDISRLLLVYGLPGDGKTHYICKELNQVDQSQRVTVTINEAFSTVTAIERLCSLPRETEKCAIFFNFTMLPPVKTAHEREQQHYRELIEEVGWFFLRILVFGYIEDIATGKSFHFPGELSWAIYIEVPSRHNMNAEEALECFREEVPTFKFLGTPRLVDCSYNYCVDGDVQLVCKYLQAYRNGTIDTLYIERKGTPVKFSSNSDVSVAECQRLLQFYMPEHVKGNKITTKLFIQYMKRRCVFLDNFPAFNFNSGAGEYTQTKQKTDTRRLGSTLLKTMLQEVADFCDPTIKENWTKKPHQQLIYDFKDGDGSLGLISLNPDLIPTEDEMKFRSIGVQIPSMKQLYSRELLEQYLSRALNIPLKDGHLSPLTKRKYVLTLDFALKMLNIHERYECRFPVIIEGETGVGKTALVSMLAELWNQSWIMQWEQSKSNIVSIIVNLMEKNIQGLPEGTLETSKHLQCMEAIQCLRAAKEVSKDVLVTISQLPCNTSDDGRFSTVLNRTLQKVEGDPLVSFVINPNAFTTIKQPNCSFESTADLLDLIFKANLQSTFHKLNIHAALQPDHIHRFFDKVAVQAKELQRACGTTRKRLPCVTAYLDEINTSSCMGLLKEIIIDRTIDGKPLPKNIFIVAACNPHRGDSLVINENYHHQPWLKGTYYVHQLHPSLELLMWDYGSLDSQQEQEYVKAKMKMLDQTLSPDNVRCLTDVIVQSQKIMRKYACKQLEATGLSKPESLRCAKSCVSQRDIQRVFTFYTWLMKVYKKFNPHKLSKSSQWKYHRRAVMVSLGIVYYMRLSTTYRDLYREFLDKLEKLRGEFTFSQAFNAELKWIIEQVELPPGIAKTQSLKENVFATIACTMTNTPLIIVGDPGSSKTLSFNIVITNVKGRQSRRLTFRETELFNSLDPHFYQCSRRTTSDEIEKVFGRAINRQRSLSKIRLPVSCVVFMDEAGLPEEKLESLKALHYHLDRQEVAFVAISNYVLDAAKTNRAVSLFRPTATREELETLAYGCIGTPIHLKRSTRDGKLLLTFCKAYMDIQTQEEFKQFKQFFGLRDFIHFIIHLRRKRQQQQELSLSLVVEALERNFNGCENFEAISDLFLKARGILTDRPQYRNVIDILKNSLDDHRSLEGDEIHSSIQSEVRYKLIIDPSEDDSLVRLLFTCGVLQKENTRLYICSDFPGDSQLRVNTIAQIRHSIEAGHTILMCQTDEIHESFYDVFNQHFRTIEDPERGVRCYANIAIGAHSKPCRVDPKFQCVVVIKQSDVKHTPAPFLNRFEKYYLTHASILETVLESLPMCIRTMMVAAQRKVTEFVQCVQKPSFYGYSNETIESLVLSVLPSREHIGRKVQHLQRPSIAYKDAKVCILETVLEKLCRTSGFHICVPSSEEISLDAEHIFRIVLEGHPEFQEALQNINNKNVEEIVEVAHSILHQSEGQSRMYTISIESCMVISVLMQWLVGYLCKRLMQVMTPEAIAIHYNRIPTAYLQTYFSSQEHFSLKELVEKQLQNIQRNICTNPSKLLVFTRSSPLIHQLPTAYPSDLRDGEQDLIERYVYAKLEQLMLCKVSLGHSQSKLQKLLSEFVSSDSLSLLVLVLNMQEISKTMVNHLRIMIEEAEWQSKKQGKLFVLLAHFPPVMFFSACYPTIFLQGWEHYYLDTIASATETKEAIVDIKDWFCICCGIPSPNSESEMVAAVKKVLLREAIPVLVSRVSFGGTKCDLNVSEKTELIETLLLETKLGTVLSTKFCAYWKPRTMVEQLQHVSKVLYDQESTLNITDSIHCIIQSAFFDYIVVMFRKMITNQVIDFLIMEDSSSDLIQNFMLDFLSALPVPSLAKLKVIGTNQQYSPDTAATYSPKFPFFKCVCEILEKAVDESRQRVNEQCDVLTDAIEDTAMATMYYEAATSIVKSKELGKSWREHVTAADSAFQSGVGREVAEGEEDSLPPVRTASTITGSSAENKTCLMVATEAIDHDENIFWHAYLQDFVHYMLHLEISPLTQQILRPYVVVSADNAVSRLVKLHVHLRLHKLDLAKVERILKPISAIHTETKLTIADTMAVPFDPSFTLAVLVVDVLFSYIASPNQLEDEEFQQWCATYRDIISIPGMMEDILSNLTEDNNIEARLNTMHATYLMVQCCRDSQSSIRGLSVFNALKSQYFEVNPEVPRLCGIIHVEMKILRDFPPQEEIFRTVKALAEKLLAFFFFNCYGHIRVNEEDALYFLECVNQVEPIEPSQSGLDCITEDISSEDPTYCCIFSISLCQQKLYLSRILDDSEHDRDPENQGSGLGFHDPQNRKIVGKVLTAQEDFGSPGPYIPKFYQHEGRVHIPEYEASQNALMQLQPLAHLYFQTVLEHLQERNPGIPYLIRIAGWHTNNIENDSTMDSEKVLLFIEKQAIIQVLIQQLPEVFDPTKRENLHAFFGSESADPVNQLLDDDSMGGGNAATVSGHGLVLAMYLQRQLNSPTQMLQLLTDDKKAYLTCMKPLQELITHQPKTDVHLFPFIGPDQSSSDLGVFYQKIFVVMGKIHNSHGQEGVDELCEIAHQSTSDCKMKLSSTTSICKKSAFRMLLWLCAYYKFFDKKRYSKYLADAITDGMKGSKHKNINMINIPETPSGMVQQQLGKASADPVFQLFSPHSGTTPDQNDIQLRHAMANMVAVVLASPRSNHLWYHMFAADGLQFSYMTGFMYPRKTVCSGGYCYDCGTELTASGRYGRSQYRSRGTLNFNSLYLVLWANFSAFCIALLTQCDAQEKIKPLFSDWQPLRHYCMARARSVWLHLSSCLEISPDERSFLVMKCMLNLLEASINNPQEFNKGIFHSIEDLKLCETAWHERIFAPSFENITGQFTEYCKLMEVTLIKDLSAIEAHYPHYPSTSELFHILLSSRAISTTEGNEVYVLSKFALEYPRLLAAGNLLPDLLEFYQWIHTELAFLVTRKDAQNWTIEQVVAAVHNKHPELKREELYERVKDGYNRYIDEIGGWIGAGPCQHEGQIYYIERNTRFLHFLSDSDEESNDWLYAVIAHIIKLHNTFLHDVLKSITERPELSSLRMLFSEHLEEYMCPNEVNRGAMIICNEQRVTPERTHKVEELLQLIRSRYLYPGEQTHEVCRFDLLQLQKDVVEAFIVGKPLISESKEAIRMPFEFKQELTHLCGTVVDISSITNRIKMDSGFRESILTTMKSPLPDPRTDEYVKQLECEFHAADYITLLEVVNGLKTACEHLITKICSSHNSGDTTGELGTMSISQFLLSIYVDKQKENIMECIGMKRLTQSQKSCLYTTQLPYMCSTLEFFVKWIKDGMYNFCTLPRSMKMRISTADHEAILKIPEVYQGNPAVLHTELQDLLEVLTNSESHLSSHMDCMQTPVIDFLTESYLYGTEEMAKLIPRTVLCQHYVALRVLIRQLSQEGVTGLNKQERWPEFVSDLWEEGELKLIKDSAKTYTTGIRNVANGTTTTATTSAEYGYDIEEEEEFTIDTQNDDSEELQHTASSDSTLQDIPSDQTYMAVASSLTIEDIQQLLKDWNLPQYMESFMKNDVDGALLLQCTQDDLKDIGVTGFSFRKIHTKFRQHLKKIKPKETAV